jgi:hypothetical protein
MSGAPPAAQGAPLDAQMIADAIAQAFAAMPAPAAPAPVNLQVVADAIAQAIAALPPAIAPVAPAVDMQVIVDAIAAAYAALPAAAGGAAAANQVVDFARTPAGAIADLLDYKKVAGDAKIFFRSTQALPSTFSLAKPNVTVLMSELQTRSSESSWSALFDMTINAVNQNFITSYGRVSLPELTTHVNTFIDLGQRPAQNDHQLYHCLTKSVDSATTELMQADRPFYMAGVARNVESGLLYLKKLLMSAEADTRATTAHARDNLGRLDAYMTALEGSDVKTFNLYVRRQLQTLTARGETTQDLVNNLFKGYLKTKSAKFHGFIERKKESYQEGAIDYTPESLMLAAENQFNALKLEQEWEVKPAATIDDPNTVLALQARIKGLEDSRRKTPKGGQERNPDGSRRWTGKMAWKGDKPKDGESGSKTVGNLTYYWCPHHGFWTAHNPSECTLAINAPADAKKAANKGTPKRTMTFAEAAAALAAEHEEEFVDQE